MDLYINFYGNIKSTCYHIGFEDNNVLYAMSDKDL